MNTRLVRQFLAVADAQSFRKAAEKLHMAQPPLSMAIKRMEEELGGPLFIRERRGVRLTPLGEAILDDARRIAFHAEEMAKAAANVGTGVAGTLRVGFVGSATYSLLPRVLPRFRERFPLITLELRELTTSQILRAVESGSLDLGLVRHPVFEPTDATLVPVEPDTLVIALPSGHPLANRRRLRLIDLADEAFVMYSSTVAMNLRSQVLLACQVEGFSPHIVQEAVQIQTVVSLVECGVGVALVPSVVSRQLQSGVVLRPVFATSAPLGIALAAATKAGVELQAARHFKDLLLEGASTALPAPGRRRPGVTGRAAAGVR